MKYFRAGAPAAGAIERENVVQDPPAHGEAGRGLADEGAAVLQGAHDGVAEISAGSLGDLSPPVREEAPVIGRDELDVGPLAEDLHDGLYVARIPDVVGIEKEGHVGRAGGDARLKAGKLAAVHLLDELHRLVFGADATDLFQVGVG